MDFTIHPMLHHTSPFFCAMPSVIISVMPTYSRKLQHIITLKAPSGGGIYFKILSDS